MRRPVIIRGAEWTVAGEPDPDEPAGRIGVACTTCTDASPWENDPKRVGMWALDHTHRHGHVHSLFLVTAQRHWRAYPTRSDATPGTAAPRTRAPRPPRAHARPRTRWLRRSGLTAARLAGHAFLALSALCLPSLSPRNRTRPLPWPRGREAQRG
ncbi:DUF7848 domain-containing protein [Streptomyces boetiae]